MAGGMVRKCGMVYGVAILVRPYILCPIILLDKEGTRTQQRAGLEVPTVWSKVGCILDQARGSS